ncbi:MAG: PilN domain-containing protein [Candidatus Nealsonbacteria bacterium]
MINLLPPQQKENILKEKQYKLVLILEILFLSFLFCLSLILVSLKIYISGQVESQKIVVQLEEENFKKSEAQSLEKEIKLINKNLLSLNSFYESQVDWVDLLERISRDIPEGAYLTNLSVVPQKEGWLSCSFVGYSSTREVLSELKRTLESEEGFKDVYFPPSNWVKSKDIDFSATFNISL